jgi:hypothetical protein
MPSPVERTPEAFVTLDKAMLASARELKPGARVRIILYGTLKELNERVGDPEGQSGDSGSLTVQLTNMKVAQNSDIAELFEEDFDG